jgi:ketosteroid isomerase-like protein
MVIVARVNPAEVMRRYADAARRGDFETAYGFYADDIVFRIPGRSSLAGEHRGRESAIHYIETARALSEHGDVEVEIVDSLTSADRFALIVTEHFHRSEGTTTISRANVYRVRDGQIVEVWIFEADQYAVDDLMGRAPLGD